MKKYKVIALWPDNKHFMIGDILTLYPSGNIDEKRYGVRHQGNWEWIISPELYQGNFILVD